MWVYFIYRYAYMWQLEAFILRYNSYVTSTFLSPRIMLIVQVANILYTCASYTQEKQIFSKRIFERNSKNERVYLQLFVSFKIGAMTHLRIRITFCFLIEENMSRITAAFIQLLMYTMIRFFLCFVTSKLIYSRHDNFNYHMNIKTNFYYLRFIKFVFNRMKKRYSRSISILHQFIKN